MSTKTTTTSTSPSTSTAAAHAPPALTALSEPAAEAAIQTACRALLLPTVRAEAATMAAAAAKQRLSHKAFLAEVLLAECDERDARRQVRRVKEAKFPRTKRLVDFDTRALPDLPPATLAHLASGIWIDKGEPLVLLGDSGTGKTHLLTGLAVAACRQKRRVRFASAAALINEMVEAKHQLQLGRALARWARYDIIALDEVGYVPLAEVGAEFLFQVIAERAEKAAVIVTTNLPFSEWTTVIPNARLCKALIDRITDRANIIETGTESYRFRRTLEKRKTKAPDTGT